MMKPVSNFHLQGIYRDILYDAQGRVKFDSQWRSNLIVNDARVLLAAFMNNASPKGVQLLEIGKGDPTWDNTLPKPNANARALFDPAPFQIPLGPKLEIVYLNESDFVVRPGPTSRLQITATLGPNEPPPVGNTGIYPLREFGLFGLLDNTEYMIDYVIHPVIHKSVDDTFIRRVRLIF
jgi:hypothetical protein